MHSALVALRHALRSLARSPSFTAPALLILALTLGAATAIFSVVDAVLLEPLDVPAGRDLVALCEEHPSLRGACVASPPNLESLRARTRTLAAVGLGREWAFVLSTGAGEPEGVGGGIATPSFFDALGARAALGRLFAEEEVGPDGDGVVVLSHALWTTRFGADPGAVGRTVSLDGEPVVVVGVLPRGFEVPGHETVELWRPLHVHPLDEEYRGWRGFSAYGRLAVGAGVDEARAELSAIYAGLADRHEEVTDEWRLAVRPALHVLVGDTRPTLFVFLGAVGLLLLIGCGNVVNLLLARGMRRRHELAVRVALGAGRGRVMGGVAAESAALALAGGAGGLLLAGALVRVIQAAAPPGIPRLDDASVDLRVAAFALVLSLITAALFGLVPALRAAGDDLAGRLRSSRGGEGSRAQRLRGALVVGELALSLVLLSSAGLLARSFAGFLAWEPGFERDGLLLVSAFVSPGDYASAELPELFRRTEASVAAVPGVRSVGMTSAGPLFGGREASRMAAGGTAVDDVDALPTVRWFDVSPGYHRTLGVPLLQGRWLAETDGRGDASVALVNETAARTLWPQQDPLGRTVVAPAGQLGSEAAAFTVVGVVRDVPPLTPGQAAEPEIYWSNRQRSRYFPYWVARVEGDAAAAAPAMREALLRAEPALDVGAFRTYDEYVRRQLVRPRFNLLLIGAFAATAIVLAAVGLYAVLAFLVTQRLREMGIRLALGSSRRGIVASVLREGGALVALGVALGLAGTVAASGALTRVVFGVEPTDPATLAATAGLLALLALAASLAPALRASRADPTRLLREE